MLDDDLSVLRASAAHVFVPVDRLVVDAAIALDDDTERHLVRVLRLRDGEPVTVTDGEGRWRSTRFRSDGPLLEPDGTLQRCERLPSSTIGTAMPKGDRLDQLVQKTTELGIDRLVLMHCERSVVRWKGERIDRQRARLQRIADESCRQSRRVWRLEIEGPVDALSMLPSCAVAESGGRAIGAADVAIAIGPEGGWSASELEQAGDLVDLGGTVLRTETAAMAAATLMGAARGGSRG
jgi:16S rRNA (uracil1498-N3)-methyltransferase